MNGSGSELLATLARGGPWSNQHPLPAPFSLKFPEDRLQVLTVLTVISSCSMAVTTLLGIYLFIQQRKGRSSIPWSGLRSPSSPKAQVVILFLHLFVAQVIQSMAWLFSSVHLARGSIQSPSPGCTTQALLQTTGAHLSQASVSAIAVHSALVIFRLRVVSLKIFGCLLASMWFFPLILGLVVPVALDHFYAVPYLSFAKVSCFLNPLYLNEFIWLVDVPLLFHLVIALMAYPIINVRLSRQLRQLQSFGSRLPSVSGLKRDDDIVRTSRRLLIFPLVTVLGNIPFMFLVIIQLTAKEVQCFTRDLWPQALGSCCLALVPIINTLIYFFSNPLFKRSTDARRNTLMTIRTRRDTTMASVPDVFELQDQSPPLPKQASAGSTDSELKCGSTKSNMSGFHGGCEGTFFCQVAVSVPPRSGKVVASFP
ncbi:hypothetical protein BCR37DRAFT_262049 [Protomyces lactucae-debilis]|uniref:Uncharacterized protein n=1 Tax=Protomyces lactucae-debilis TaxID=2754530 RepID=A0A1Y2FJX5_PROLT|nr:uncharacterized protein BCR37DRAFT_262049 [Protomyces lactucae-debilis]ORY84258.1 hypothetical protein BCR37DRAFT_262049 [Protomyces lactucae-debilis]